MPETQARGDAGAMQDQFPSSVCGTEQRIRLHNRNGGTASNTEGSREYTVKVVADRRQGVVLELGGEIWYMECKEPV